MHEREADMQSKEDIIKRIKFLEEQQKISNDTDYKIICAMIIGNLKWVLLDK